MYYQMFWHKQKGEGSVRSLPIRLDLYLAYVIIQLIGNILMTDPKWKFIEKVVTIIERYIAPTAKVRRNVFLPVLKNKTRRPRQCDIVIEDGKAPRQTISIVEVQDQGTKPEIGEFHGWIKKMQEVGAQHLICVSELGFPDSIQKEADEIGPTVRLLTLKKLEKGEWPLPPTFFSDTIDVVQYDRLMGLQMKYPHLVRVDPKPKLPNPEDKIFRLRDGRLVSTTDIMDWHLFGNPKNIMELPPNKHISLTVNFTGLFEHKTYSGEWIKLEWLRIHIQLLIRLHKITWEFASYEQRHWGKFAWVLRATAMMHTTPYNLIIPIKRIGPGEYSMGRPVILGDADAFMSIGNQGYKAERYTDQ